MNTKAGENTDGRRAELDSNRSTYHACAAQYFHDAGWAFSRTSEHILLTCRDDPEIAFYFPSVGSTWRWWRDVYVARLGFLAVIERAKQAAQNGDPDSRALIRWLQSPNSPYPELMNEAYKASTKLRTRPGWLRTASEMERSWRPGVDPLNIARQIALS